MGEYWFTTLSGIRRAEPDWEAVAAYEPPVRRFLDERYAFLGTEERDDLLQEILLAMRERLVAGYDAAKGPFRPFLRTAIANKVRDRLRRRRAAPGGVHDALEAIAAADRAYDSLASEDDAASIDFEAVVVRAVRGFHDLRASGPARDRTAVYVLSGALVDGLSNTEIAARERLSADQVKRILQAAREEILGAVLASLLPTGAKAAVVARGADLARGCLREPRGAVRMLEEEADAGVRGAAEAFLERMRSVGAGAGAGGGGGGSGGRGSGEMDFVRGVRAIFEA